MTIKNKAFAVLGILVCLNFFNISANSQDLTPAVSKYPDFSTLYVGKDKFENFNRKMFNFNLKLNKCVIRPVHVVWSSVMPKYGMDRIQSAHTNIVYPRRLVSTLLQKDFKASGRETVRFLTNTTIGLELPGINDSIWTELSIWNRCFAKRIKTASVSIDPTRAKYKYKYIMQKDKNSPVAIIYPSIGEGITSHHSVVMAKMFYVEGYSVIIQGSHFQWEFVKSMPVSYRPGLPSQDAEYLKKVTSEIVNSLQAKYHCEFKDKILIGTSFGAMTTLFLADKEYRDNTLNITKYISINPPIELLYAMKQIDKNTAEWNKNPDDLKKRVALTAAKVVQIAQLKELPEIDMRTLPFSSDEAKLITGFIMHQKLSDLIFTLENASKSKKSDIYTQINNMDYQDYAQKYLLEENTQSVEDLAFCTSLNSLSDFLKHSGNYKIYHSLDDYLVNEKQLRILKEYAGNKAVLMEHGGHLGFLYRPEFLDELKKDISLTPQKI